ncbi:peptide/nickel transport system substrate-binding protein/oligopeptide transport system substrate-binding protein [Motilibacter peucedani]|uniref:Peptide/nickel transport system substrate-binding protein/oligopeptide transport system substrate-binding protein n=1 Tax=Motilibacter peucedani TaxID=598650 RepID=A0A420XMU4_9ACTN|nr:ABC transporter substrate-binding protein [Motilibacter peucedani]RKS72603.1 peptide/nickel transport system substrate-binding protein/oligopeptide transport system substrate-binding protein [Motilibacter peucedani]
MRVRVRRGLAAAGAVVTAAAVLAGCGGSATPTGGAQGDGRVRIAIPEPDAITPTAADETAGIGIVHGLFTGLVAYDSRTAPVLTPLAKAVTTSDHQHWTVRLASGWTFHNGEAVTSSSFVDAWNYGALGTHGQYAGPFYAPIEGYDDVAPVDDSGEPLRPRAQTMRGLHVVDAHTFTVTLAHPDTTFLAELGNPAFYPLPHVALTDPEGFAEAPVGNGPFRLGAWVPDQRVTLERFAGYRGTQPHVDGVDFTVYASMDTAVNDLASDAVDVVTGLSPSTLARRAEFGDRYQTFPSSYFAFIGLPGFDPQLADVRVRKAISMSVDRATIARTVFAGTRTPADAFVGPSAPGYRPGSCGETCTYDPAAARALFEAAGGAKTLPALSIRYNADGPHRDWVVAACHSVTDALGIPCRATPAADFPTLLDAMGKAAAAKKSFGAFRLAQTLDYPSVENYLTPLYSSTGASNLVGYSNPRVDSLLAAGRSAASAERAQADWAQAEDLVAADVPLVPLFFGQTTSLRSARVHDLSIDAFESIDLVGLRVG